MAKAKSKKSVKNSKRTFVYGLLAVLALGFVLGFFGGTHNISVSTTGYATQAYQIGAGTNSTGFAFGDFFARWNKGSVDVNVMKYFFWGIVCLFIFNILDNVKILSKSKFFNFMLSLVISFIAVAFITPSEVYTMLISYNALGLVFSMALPFFILIWGSSSIMKGPATSSKSITVSMLWILFVIMEIYKMITFFSDVATGSANFNWVVAGVMGLITLVSMGIVLFNRKFREGLRRLEEEASMFNRRTEAQHAGQNRAITAVEERAARQMMGDRGVPGRDPTYGPR